MAGPHDYEKFAPPGSGQSFKFNAPVSVGANVDLPFVTRAIRCEGAGSLVVIMAGDGAERTVYFKAGETRMLRVTRIKTITSATNVEIMA